jgi:hypothetical protein
MIAERSDGGNNCIPVPVILKIWELDSNPESTFLRDLSPNAAAAHCRGPMVA